MTTNQTAPVSDEELDQMIWKLERDGMTPKMLSLMREVREVRRARPVAWVMKDDMADTDIISTPAYPAYSDAESKTIGDLIPLYAAPTAPVVPDTLPCAVSLEPGLKFGKGVRTQCMLDALNRRAEYYAELDAMTPEQRAEHDAGIAEFKAMLSPGNSEQLKPVSNRDELPATQFKPVADLYGITSPTGSETSFTFDAIEAANFIDGGWSVQEYVELERYQEAMIGNSPATPDGWIPVSERMPEVGDIVLTAIDGCVNVGEAERSGANYRYFTSVISGRELPATHWQPLPEAPKVVG